MRRYYLGLNAGGPRAFSTLFLHGTKQDLRELSELIAGKYQGAPILTKNGRSALGLALKAYFDPGDKIVVNGFTCYAVIEAIRAAGMTPIFADIEPKTLNFDEQTLEKLFAEPVSHGAKGIIVQNTLGNPVEMRAIEKFAKAHQLLIVEDLAHSAGIKYPDGREAGTVGAATVLSFGKDKAINTISGGAAILRATTRHEVKIPAKAPRLSDHLRARFYPLLTALCRGLNHVHLGGGLMRVFLALHLVERSADNKLDFKRRPSKFEAKMAVREIQRFRPAGQPKIREFLLVEKRAEVLLKLREAGYFFDSFWYEKPVAPERYYADVKFPEKKCPVATKVASRILNLPNYYSAAELAPARAIIKPYAVAGLRAPKIPAEEGAETTSVAGARVTGTARVTRVAQVTGAKMTKRREAK